MKLFLFWVKYKDIEKMVQKVAYGHTNLEEIDLYSMKWLFMDRFKATNSCITSMLIS